MERLNAVWTRDMVWESFFSVCDEMAPVIGCNVAIASRKGNAGAERDSSAVALHVNRGGNISQFCVLFSICVALRLCPCILVRLCIQRTWKSILYGTDMRSVAAQFSVTSHVTMLCSGPFEIEWPKPTTNGLANTLKATSKNGKRVSKHHQSISR
jgi:hypothetical protein